MKICTKCELNKDDFEFSKDRSKKDGLQSQCKSCNKERYQVSREGVVSKKGNNQYTDATHCKRGHPFSGENLKITSEGTRRCRTCYNQNLKDYRATMDKDKERARQRNRYHEKNVYFERIFKLYGITKEEYEMLLVEQNNVCGICKKSCSTGRSLAVDHCHETGKIRGLLCARCNRGLGLLGDTYEAVLDVLEYFREESDAEIKEDKSKKGEESRSRPLH